MRAVISELMFRLEHHVVVNTTARTDNNIARASDPATRWLNSYVQGIGGGDSGTRVPNRQPCRCEYDSPHRQQHRAHFRLGSSLVHFSHRLLVQAQLAERFSGAFRGNRLPSEPSGKYRAIHRATLA
jgi:hypothetical protein